MTASRSAQSSPALRAFVPRFRRCRISRLFTPLGTCVSPKRRMTDTTDLWGPYQKNLEWRSLYIAKHISGEQYQITKNQNDETGM